MISCINFAEFFTAVSDLLLSAVCFRLYRWLRNTERKKEYLAYWALFYLFIALGTFFGGIAHLISGCKESLYYKVTWVCMQLFTGGAILYAQTAIFNSEIKSRKIKKLLLAVSRIQFLIYIPCVISYLDFKVAALNSLIGLVQVMVLSFPTSSYNRAYRTLISLGVLVSFITVYVNRQKISLASWFSHNDLAHVFMLISIILFYQGIRYRHKLDLLFNK